MSVSIANLLATTLNDTVENNRTLPSAFYTSVELLQLEITKLFKPGWVCLGRVDEIPSTGDYFTTSLLDEPVIVVRTGPDRIAVLANVCRHRGMPLAEGRGNTKKFRCSYHAWTYNLDGSLRHAPLMKQAPLVKRSPLMESVPIAQTDQAGSDIAVKGQAMPDTFELESLPVDQVPAEAANQQHAEQVPAEYVEQSVAGQQHAEQVHFAQQQAGQLQAKNPLAECRLPEIRSYCWGGFVFASLDADGGAGLHTSDQPIDLSSLQAEVGDYHMEEMVLIDQFEETWDCNWKSLVENFMDGYHLSVVHPETLRALTPTNLCRKAGSGKHYTSYIANYAGTAPARRNYHPDLSAGQCRQSRLFCIYPSLVVSVSADTLAFFALQPKGLDQVSVKWGLASYERDLSPEQKQLRIDKWQAINAEDHAILQRLRAGLHSSYYEAGPLAPDHFEGCVGDFHRALLESMSQ